MDFRRWILGDGFSEMDSRTQVSAYHITRKRGQHSGELTANFDEDAPEEPSRLSLRKQWISPPLKTPLKCLLL